MKTVSLLPWLTQLGLSVALPLAGFIFLALWLRSCRNVQELSGDSREVAAYMSGDVIPSEKKGWCLVTVDGYSLGWGKGDGRVLKNHYPKGLRRMG